MPDILVGRVDHFADRDRKVVALGDREIGVFHLDGEFFVVVSAQEKAQ